MHRCNTLREHTTSNIERSFASLFALCNEVKFFFLFSFCRETRFQQKRFTSEREVMYGYSFDVKLNLRTGSIPRNRPAWSYYRNVRESKRYRLHFTGIPSYRCLIIPPGSRVSFSPAHSNLIFRIVRGTKCRRIMQTFNDPQRYAH